MTFPRLESPRDVKSATRSGSRVLMLPRASNEPAGPIPAARRPMNAPTPNANAPMAYAPPSATRRQVMCGLAFTASVAIVFVGVCCAARCA